MVGRRRSTSDSVKLTYIFLIQRTLDTRPRWVVDSMAELASQRGISLKTFRKHCDALRKLAFIETIPYRLLSDDYNMNEHAILLLDLPDWYRTPQDLAALPHNAEQDDLDDLDLDLDLDLDDDDDGCTSSTTTPSR